MAKTESTGTNSGVRFVVKADRRKSNRATVPDAMPHTTLRTRIRAEYLEMPGLQLTLEQVQRLCGVERTLCKAVLEALVDATFLCVKSNGTYARLTDGVHRPHPAKADVLNPTDVRKAS